MPTGLQSVFVTYGGNNKVTVGDGVGVVIGGPGDNTITAGANYATVDRSASAEYVFGRWWITGWCSRAGCSRRRP